MKKLIALILSAILTLSALSALAADATIITQGDFVTEIRDYGDYQPVANYLMNPKIDENGVLTVPYAGGCEEITVRFVEDNINDELKIKKVIVENGVQSVSGSLGYGADIYLPATVSDFTYSDAANIFVDAVNPYLCDIDGVLFSKDKTVLKVYGRYRSETVYSVPDGVVEIKSMANKALTEIEFPQTLQTVSNDFRITDWYKSGNMRVIGDGILIGPCKDENVATPPEAKSIADYAFETGTYKSVKIGGSVKKIGKYAFNGCVITDELIIEEGVEEIGYCAFGSLNANRRYSEYPWLKEVRLPKSLKTDSDGFYNAKIEEIRYSSDLYGDCDYWGKVFVPKSGNFHESMSKNGRLCFDNETGEALLPEYRGNYIERSYTGAWQLAVYGSDFDDDNKTMPCFNSEYEWVFDGDVRPFVQSQTLYVPLRIACERFNVPLYWNEELGIAQVGERAEIEPSRPKEAFFGDENLVRYNGKIAELNSVSIPFGQEEAGTLAAINIGGSIYVPLYDLAVNGLVEGFPFKAYSIWHGTALYLDLP